MRILVYTNLWMKESDARYGFIQTLKRKHDVLHCTLDKNIIEANAEFRPNIIISFKGEIPFEAVEIIKDARCKTIQLFPDDPDLMLRGMQLYPGFDYFFTNSIQAQKEYHRLGFDRVKVCGFGVDPELVKASKFNKKYECDIMFAGGDNHKRYRYTYLNALRDLDLKVYGKWSKDVHGLQNEILYGKAYFSALKSCKIGIDLSQSAAGFMNIKWKTFELAASGALVMANKFDEMNNYFEYDKEIVGFSSAKELREKCEYYLEHEVEREKIARAGYKRFMKDHTWEKRIEYIFKECNI